jgi:hypothetical protein
MIAKISDGSDTEGLISHLVGEGTDPVLIAHSQDRFLVERGWWDDEAWYRLYANDAAMLSYDLDESMRLAIERWSVDPPRGTVRHYASPLGHAVVLRDRPNHVWYCVLTLCAGEPALSRQTWRMIATDIMVDMRFSRAGLEPDWPWVAIHNGTMPNGSDAIHLVANVMREDGQKWPRWKDQWHVQRAVNAAEHKYGLEVIEGRDRRIRDREKGAGTP